MNANGRALKKAVGNLFSDSRQRSFAGSPALLAKTCSED